MAETATIDLISFNSAEINTKTSSKSSAENPSNFSEIFDNANKAYSTKENYSQTNSNNTNTNNNYEPKTEDSNTQNTNNVKDSNSTENQEPIANDQKETNVENNSKQTNENSENKVSNNEDVEKPTATSNATNKISDTEQIETPKPVNLGELIPEAPPTVQNQTNVKASNDKNSIDTQVQSVILSKEEIVQTDNTTQTKEPTQNTTDVNSNSTLTTDNILNEMVLVSSVNNIPNNQTTSHTNTNNQQKEQPVQTLQTTQNVQTETSIDLINSAVNSNNNNNANSNINTTAQVQVQKSGQQVPKQNQIQQIQQIQQIPQNIVSEKPNNTAQETQVVPQNDTQENDVQIPIIKTNTEKLASDVNVNNTSTETKQDLKTVLDKTSLTQEALDKLNAKITSVDTSKSNSNSNSNNMLNGQNTEDQMVKLTLENNNTNTNTVNFAGLVNDSTNQMEFAKAPNGVQAQTHTQAPKEINNTEILSQINNKLSNLKDAGTTKINIVLRPENLGKVNLELINSKDGLTAQLTTNNAQVKEILDKSLDGLRETLGNQGININSVTVKVEETQKQSNDMLSFENQNQSEQNSQQQSDNTKNTKENEFSFDENIDNEIDETILTIDQESTVATESTVSITSHTGKIDYKV